MAADPTQAASLGGGAELRNAAFRPAGTAGAAAALAARYAVPRRPGDFVRRPRLLARFTTALSHPLLLITGPAGAGKSLLAADWSTTRAARAAGPVAWLTAEPGDEEPGTFWACVLEALRRAGLEDLPATVATPWHDHSVGRPLLTKLATVLAGRARPVVLIVDQFERATGRQVADGLDFLLTHAGDGLRLVLISRAEPLLPLHRYRAADLVAEIRAADLAFAPAEIATLLRRHDIDLPDTGVEALWERTEGWAVGLRLSILAARQSDDPEVYLKEFEAGETTLADFILEEVLAAQPAEAQEVLLRTSIAQYTHADLARVLTGRPDAGRILEDLARGNTFVEPLGHRCYRHHRIFAEILRHRLRARDPELEADLHRRAAHWLRANGRLTDAVAHAAAGEDWEFAAGELVHSLAIGHLLVGRDAERLRHTFARMPQDVSGTGPELVRAALALAHPNAERARAHLDRAERTAANPPQEAGRSAEAAAEWTCAFLRLLVAALTGDADEARRHVAATEALGSELPDAVFCDHPELPGLLHTALGSAYLCEGELEAARDSLSRAVEASPGPVEPATRQDALGRLALTDQLRGEFARARTEAARALAEAESCGLAPGPSACVAHLVLARAQFERDELDAAGASLGAAAGLTADDRDDRDPVTWSGVAVQRAKLLLVEGEPDAALDLLASARAAGPDRVWPPWARAEAAVAAATAQLALGNVAAALTEVAREAPRDQACAVAAALALLTGEHDGEAALKTLEAADSFGAPIAPVAVRALLIAARASHSIGDEVAAVRRLSDALDRARSDGLLRPFRENDAWVRQALRRCPALGRAHLWLPNDLRALPPPVRATADPPLAAVEPLSEREREVLERVAQMMSTAEIAEDLHLSVNTVKTHLKSVNRKLCTTRRAQAVRRARALRMLP